jgi:cytochrome c biogenesis protein CcdA
MSPDSFMENINIPVLTALFLGFLTAISPCPMATNIAAVAYISRRIDDRKYAVIAGTSYTAGRMFSYSVIGMLIIGAGLEIPWVAAFFQDTSVPVLGPILIAVGIFMLVVSKVPLAAGGGRLAALGEKIAGWRIIGGFLLGVIFALAFCPYSAVLFFAMLIPLALKSSGGITFPAVYAIGTGLPVLVFGTLLSLGISGVSSWLNALTRAERIIRVLVALIFIGVGIYYVILWLQS